MNQQNNPEQSQTLKQSYSDQLARLGIAQAALMQNQDLLCELGERFFTAGYELYLVGGSVRDAFLSRLSPDLDFTTNARPEQIQRILAGWVDNQWDTGIAYGTISAVKREHQIEITTFRADQYDRVSRNPEVQFGNSIADDLLRRDFRINAMAVRIDHRGPSEFIDPLNGLDDLIHEVIDTPATPEESFADDPLRMLRAARFVSQLGFRLTSDVQRAMKDMADQIKRITVERVQVELDKLMLGAYPTQGIRTIVDTGLADYVLPEIPAMQLEIDEHHQHKDVYQHSLTVLNQAIALETEPDLTLRWAALLHDIGKPATKRNEPGCGVSFHHHEVVGAKLARKRLRALKYPKHFIADVSQLIFLHLRFHGYGTGTWTDSAVRRYVTDAGDLLPRLHKLTRADCTTRNKRRAANLRAAYDDLEDRIAKLQTAENLAKVRPDLDGNDIMNILGIKPGPMVGKAWKYLKDLRLEQGPLEPEAVKQALLDWWKQQESQ